MSIDKDQVKTAAQGRWREILPALGGVAPSRLDGSHGPCPVCGGTDRHRTLPDFAETGAMICNQCGAGDGFHWLGSLHSWTFPETLDEVERFLGLVPSGTNVAPTNGHYEKPAPSAARATGSSKPDWRKLWNQAQPATEAGVGTYLANRGLTFALHGDCRFMPNAKAKVAHGAWHEGPAMLWLVRGPDGEPVAVHRTFLSDDCQGKASIDGCKRLLGKPGHGAAVLLTPATGETLAIAEGIETGFVN